MNLTSRITEAPITLGQNASMTILHANGVSRGSPNDNTPWLFGQT